MRGRSLVLAVAAGLLAVLIPAGPARAQGNENCPTGFTWERMSGQCCVQDRTTLPPHGKIGYTGNSFCEDGWYDIFDRRPTTNGEGPPGCPGYTSFVFLVECASSPEEAAQRQAAVDAEASGNPITPLRPALKSSSGSINPLSDSLYGSGGMPSPADLALAGGVAGTILATLGASTLRGSGGAVGGQRTRDLLDRLRANEHELEDAQQLVDGAKEEYEALTRQRDEWSAAALRMRDQLVQLDAQMRQCDSNIAFANKGKYTLFALGLIATLLSFEAAIPAAGAAVLTGIDAFNVAVYKLVVALETGGGGLLHGLLSGEWQKLKMAASEAKTNAVFLGDRIVDHLKYLDRQCDEAESALDAAIKHMDAVREQGADISRQIASP